jgi:endonuclease/exonuclease/phosphatase family metal-dependent hydrolase
MRVITWNLLHGIALAQGESMPSLAQVASKISADIIGLQEVDRDQPRSEHEHQTQIVAQAMGLPHWVFAPAIIGTPGESWEGADDSHIHAHDHLPHSQTEPHYGVGLASRYPMTNVEVLRFKAAPLSLPLVIPGNPRPRIIKVADEPRVAIIADLETPSGIVTVATAHLSFVPGYNVKQIRQLSKHLTERKNPVLIIGDFNLPGQISARVTRWDSLAKLATYPTFKPRIQFDHMLARGFSEESVKLAKASAHTLALEISDHCALVVEISN